MNLCVAANSDVQVLTLKCRRLVDLPDGPVVEQMVVVR